ncbi:MAG: hypothetical protein Q3976_07160 [Corynebacterium sp.]|nr:hypothetical protein [Corynebacterium sp.]
MLEVYGQAIARVQVASRGGYAGPRYSQQSLQQLLDNTLGLNPSSFIDRARGVTGNFNPQMVTGFWPIIWAALKAIGTGLVGYGISKGLDHFLFKEDTAVAMAIELEGMTIKVYELDEKAAENILRILEGMAPMIAKGSAAAECAEDETERCAIVSELARLLDMAGEQICGIIDERDTAIRNCLEECICSGQNNVARTAPSYDPQVAQSAAAGAGVAAPEQAVGMQQGPVKPMQVGTHTASAGAGSGAVVSSQDAGGDFEMSRQVGLQGNLHGSVQGAMQWTGQASVQSSLQSSMQATVDGVTRSLVDAGFAGSSGSSFNGSSLSGVGHHAGNGLTDMQRQCVSHPQFTGSLTSFLASSVMDCVPVAPAMAPGAVEFGRSVIAGLEAELRAQVSAGVQEASQWVGQFEQAIECEPPAEDCDCTCGEESAHDPEPVAESEEPCEPAEPVSEEAVEPSPEQIKPNHPSVSSQPPDGHEPPPEKIKGPGAQVSTSSGGTAAGDAIPNPTPPPSPVTESPAPATGTAGVQGEVSVEVGMDAAAEFGVRKAGSWT